MANQKRLTERNSLPAPTAEGREWADVRHELQEWAEMVVSILDNLATLSDFDEHNDLNGLQGGSETERYHFTQAQHAYLAPHQSAPDPHVQYQLRSEKGQPDGYASLDATTRVPIPELGSGTPDGTKFLADDRTWQPVTSSQHSHLHEHPHVHHEKDIRFDHERAPRMHDHPHTHRHDELVNPPAIPPDPHFVRHPHVHRFDELVGELEIPPDNYARYHEHPHVHGQADLRLTHTENVLANQIFGG